MFFKRQDIASVKQHVFNRGARMKMIYGYKDDERFNNLLTNIRMETKYKEGQQISKEHHKALMDDVKISLQSMTQHIAKNSKKIDPITDPVKYVATAVDCYYITAMEKLGCPNIPLFAFDKDFKKEMEKTAIAIHKSFVKYDMSKDAAFTKQRGKDAVEVAVIAKRHFDEISKDKNKSRHVGELVAEYQALQQRQKNHGWFWRAFHQTENMERNELLKLMSDSIKKVIPKGIKVDLDNDEPASIARALANARIVGNLDHVAVDRYSKDSAEKIFGCKPADDMAPIWETDLYNFDGTVKEPMSSYKNFLNDIKDKDDIISDRLKQDSPNEKNNIIMMDTH